MRKKLPFIFWVACSGSVLLSASLDEQLDQALAFAETQLDKLAVDVLENNPERFVNYTDVKGKWRLQEDNTWTSGFLPGLFWYFYDYTGEGKWRERAENWTEGVRSRATATDNDTGFQIFDSFGLGYLLTGKTRKAYRDTLLTAAQNLAHERYNETIGCYRSWPGKADNPFTLPFEVNIDQLMNLELGLWAAENGGPNEYFDYAVSHADKTWENNVRENGGTYHVVTYNLDGSVASKSTHQGWKKESTWSRGQAWAVYGYAMIYRHTHLPRMLDHAKRCFDYFIDETGKDRADYVPYSDFDAPIDSNNPRDTSAAAIVAAAALHLYELTGESVFLERGEAILTSLSSGDYLAGGSGFQSILRSASEKWGNPEVGAVFGDFFFVQAILHYKSLQASGFERWGGYPVFEGGFVDTANFLGVLYIGFKPWVFAFSLPTWLYIPEETITKEGAWIYWPAPQWSNSQWKVGEFLDTGNWMGVFYYTSNHWVYSFSLKHWLYLPETSINDPAAWIYLMK